MKLISFLIIFILSLGCIAHKQSKIEIVNTQRDSITTTHALDSLITQPVQATKPQSYNFEFKITRYHPYCGGAAPTENMLHNYSPEVAEFVLTNLITQEKIIFKTDSSGVKRMQLKTGKYGVKEKYKDIPFEVFYKKYNRKSDSFAKSEGKSCYKKWWASQLVVFEIADTTTVLKKEIVIADACFTGKNPCLTFIGPNPP